MKNLTDEKYIGQLLAEEMLKVMNSVNIKRFAAVITDNESNVAAVQKLITIQFSKIFNIKYIAYCLNLILYDITLLIKQLNIVIL